MRIDKNYLNLVKEMTATDFKLRYHGTYLGFFWSLLRPMLTLGVTYLVFAVFLNFSVKNYVLYLFLGIILWNFFAEATSQSISSLAAKAPLIKKINFPRDIIIVSSTTTAFLNLLFHLTVFGIFFVASEVGVSPKLLLAAVFLLLLYFLTLGASLFLSALYAKFKDLRYMWEIILQLGFWVTPIVYTVPMIPERFHFLVYFNPLTRVIQYTREAVLEQRVSNYDGMAALFFVSIATLVVGIFVFNKRAPYLAEDM